MIGVSPSGKAPGFDLGIRWFESSYPCHHFSSVDTYCCVLGVSPSGKAPGFDLGIRWFESSYPCHFKFKKTEQLTLRKCQTTLTNSRKTIKVLPH